MTFKKLILFVLLLSILMSGFLSKTYANQRWNLLEGIDPNPSEFKELEIGKKIVYWHQRTLGEAIVELNYIVFHFDRKTQELIDVKMNWREDLPPVLPKLNITKEEAEAMVEGRVDFSQLYIISPESFIFSPIKPTPENPCWVVVSIGYAGGCLLTVVDAVKGTVLGYGIPPPYTAFSLSGPLEDQPCDGEWTAWKENAQYWFNMMGYSTEAVKWPTEDKVKSHIQSKSTAMFYEIAHSSDSDYFKSGCDGGFYEITWADEIEDWISGYTKMPFAFIGSCFGMCEVSDDTLSYEFRKGSTEDTATVGYCRMSEEPCFSSCWPYSVNWQTTLFWHMSNGDTVKEAFDAANASYSGCFDSDCMRFAGDENFAVVPVVFRVYDPISHWKLDETTGITAEDSAGDNDGTLIGDPQWVDGKINGALEFDGIDDYVSLYPISSLGGDSVTIAAWIYAHDLPVGDHSILIQYGQPFGYYFYVKDNRPALWLNVRQAESLDAIDVEAWYHLAGTNDGHDLKIYVDGIWKDTADSFDEAGGSYDAYIGSNFDGLIDDVHVYNYAMDIGEIWDLIFDETPRFCVKNSSGVSVAWFDNLGNLFLKGEHLENAADPIPPDSFIIRDSGNDTVAYIDSQGNLWIDGNLTELCGACSPAGDAFIIRDSSDDNVAYIDFADGDLWLTGELYENREQ